MVSLLFFVTCLIPYHFVLQPALQRKQTEVHFVEQEGKELWAKTFGLEVRAQCSVLTTMVLC